MLQADASGHADTVPLYKLGDFGLAVMQGQWDAEDGDGGYVAPELLSCEALASPAADVYSLGARRALSSPPPPSRCSAAQRSGCVSKGETRDPHAQARPSTR